MLKRPLFLLAFLFICRFAMANKVDDLKTDKDVEKFILSLSKNIKGKEFTIKQASEIKKGECENIITGEVKNWEKLDINGDGRNDLLVNGSWKNSNNGFLAIDQGDNKFKLIILNYGPGECEFIESLKIDNKTLILFQAMKTLPVKPGQSLILAKEVAITDTLIYNFGTVVELNKKSSFYKIDSIKFETGRCFGKCPVFSIAIDRSGNAIYKAGIYDRRKGNFKKSVSQIDLNRFYEVLNYINVKSLEDNYSVNWTDDATYTIVINFSDGSVKSIKDYGGLGTFGLRKLYALFFDLRENQNWQKVN